MNASEDNETDQFLKQCQTSINLYKAGKLSMHEAAAQINASPDEYPFEDAAHPMLHEVASLAFDITEEYRSDEDDAADWQLLVNTVEAYLKGNWQPTCWLLSAMYGEHSDGELTHSYSVVVRRQDGQTAVKCASDVISSAVNYVAQGINAAQTDERYLQNLTILLPPRIDMYELLSVDVGEYLTEPNRL